MRKKYVTKAIVLHGRNYGEADRIMVAFTKEQGRVDFMARGVRKMKSKNRALIQPFTYSELELLDSGSGLDLLTQGVLIESFVGLHRDFDKFSYASFLGEFLNQILPVKEPYPELCFQFLHTLNHLDKKPTQPALPTWSFVLKAIDLLGYRPLMDECSVCGGQKAAQSETDFWYSFQEGCLYCEHCQRPAGCYALPGSTLRDYLSLEGMDPRCGPIPTIDPARLCRLESFVEQLLEHLLEREQKSSRLIRILKKMRDPQC